MKTWAWFRLILAILIFQASCAPGYYQKPSPIPEESPHFVGPTFENPETPEEENLRIWHEEMDR
jgi:hypothetical protein